MISLFKPNKNVTGSLISFRFLPKQSAKGENYKEGCVYASLAKQTGWSNGKGSFKGGQQLAIKFNLIELGKIVNALQRRTEFSAYHGSNESSTQINLRPWNDQKSGELKGFGLLAVRKQGEEESKFSIGIGLGEDVVICEFLRAAIREIIMAGYAEEKRLAKERVREVKETASYSPDAETETEEEEDSIPF